MRVVVTGGAGFIGANLVRALLERAEVEHVTVIDDLSTGARENLAGLDVSFHEGSVLDRDLLDSAFAGADAVVHLAALPSVPRSLADPVSTHHANTTGTLQVLEAARRAGGPHVTAASSSSVYGANPELPKRESMAAMPTSPYAVSKLTAEAYLGAYHHSFGLPVLPFRFFNVFGPLQAPGHAYAAVVPAFVDAALAGRPLPVHGDGTQSRDFTYVGTVCRILTSAVLGRVTSPRPVNLAYGTRTSLLELAAEVERCTGRPVTLEHSAPRAGDVPHSQADSSRLRALFPDITAIGLHEGLARTVDWFRTRHAPLSGSR
ncbi:NAD-dependent epimerase/dehydratase family protein [Kitasatospora sp. NPDC056783]|uniref:NAD-dependent epimerase/dehydratase family protein n=1 Tax=Kitasatospora sp. NPDC056783 TaxID=3345943 RepID=UPI0036C635FD